MDTVKKTRRTYSTFSYADAFFWRRCGLAKQVGLAIGEQYVLEETQIGNITRQLRDLGYTALAKEVRSYTEEGEREERE
jgi:hypothetical protein